MNSRISKIILFVILFFFVFGWKMSQSVDLIILVAGGCIVLAFALKEINVSQKLWLILFYMILICAYSTAVVIVNGAVDSFVSLRSLSATIVFSGGIAIFLIYRQVFSKNLDVIILKHLFYVISIHGFLIVLMYLLPGLREKIYDITDAKAYVNLTTPFKLGLRISGLTYGLSQTSVVQLYALIILPFVWGASRIPERLILLLCTCLATISIILTGRTGLVLGTVIVPTTWFLYLICPAIPLKRRSMVKLRSVSSFLFLMGAFTITAIFFPKNLVPVRFSEYNLSQASEILKLVETRGRTTSTTAISQMYFLPDSQNQLIFGNSNLGRGDMRYIPSDVGYIRGIYAIGLVGMTLTCLVYLTGIYMAFDFAISNYERISLGLIIMLVIVTGLVLNFKELALFTRNQWSVQSLLIVLIAIHNHDKKFKLS